MKLEWLRYFIALAEEQSFQRAAQRLHLTPQALSQCIAKLERSLAVTLFDRERKSKGLTAVGELVYHEAGVLLRAWEEAEARIAAFRAEPSAPKAPAEEVSADDRMPP